ncbi:protease SohB [Halomonas sp. ZH2S]|uniref:Protease SohB n=1 Tax=Vreelandella zhuhanensis TaxID=2684210 RepID=A0A7X3KS05_9GAMM|nr:protease SohB [Halomonas zhuhanensis]MWJ28587.1 protease SohB [Halomonas zhuhanensis]
MNEWAVDIGTFVVQVIIVVMLVGGGLLLLLRSRHESSEQLTLHIETLNDQRRYRRRRLAIAATSLSQRKSLIKSFRRDDKAKQKGKGDAAKGAEPARVWVLDFHGDLKASATEHFAEEISAVLDVAERHDEVVIRLESGGGLVHAYGLAAAQMDRLREAGLKTVVCVDKVAASGGYLMACTASEVRAAPFAVLGSIGVVAQVPNIHRLLKRHDIDVELLTAGKYKRTLTIIGENTQEGREKFIEDLEDTHRLFKEYVAKRRPSMDIESVATGEIWYGSEAVGKGLIDALGTSEAYLVERMQASRVLSVKLEPPKTMSNRLGLAISTAAESVLLKGMGLLEASRWHKQ